MIVSGEWPTEEFERPLQTPRPPPFLHLIDIDIQPTQWWGILVAEKVLLVMEKKFL